MATKSKGGAVPVGMAKSDNDWMAEDDMRTLLRAGEIRKDPKRLAAARAAAKRKLDEKKGELASMRSLANG